ncbi:hypothetical protein FQA39_LY16798 [Lamprigera yunnana]|nr:hypothetical protein FQA39_LY16798 [Lamprigera yunnana]
MPKVNLKDLAPLKFPKLHPEETVREYLHSKTVNSLLKCVLPFTLFLDLISLILQRKYPEWDLARSDPASLLVVKKRELHVASTRLSNRKAEAIQTRKDINGMWQDLENRENTLKLNFVKFNKFVKENQEKRERAERQLLDNKTLITKREDEIKEMNFKYGTMLDIRSNMDKNIRSHKMYERFLMNVSKAVPAYRTIDSILDRYEALAEARRQLGQRQESEINTLEDVKARLLKLVEENVLVLMGLHNVVEDLRSRYETAKVKASHWETMVTQIKNVLVSKLADLQEVKQSVWHVYLGMCKRKEIEPTIADHDLENQLLFIKGTIGELKKINRIATKKAAKDSFEKAST